jgi:hypothetical protein
MLVAPLVCYGIFSVLVWARDFTAVDAAIADVAAVTRSQKVYADFNGGFNDADLSCLERRGTCIPSRRAEWAGRAFMESSPGSPPLQDLWRRKGRVFTAGPPVDSVLLEQEGLSPTSVRGFRCVADASSQRPRWASLALLPRPPLGFCGDGSGRVCELSSLPTSTGTVCPADCKSLEGSLRAAQQGDEADER